jgi:hypothetical protein
MIIDLRPALGSSPPADGMGSDLQDDRYRVGQPLEQKILRSIVNRFISAH